MKIGIEAMFAKKYLEKSLKRETQRPDLIA